jgi:hypothetical protein
LGHGVLGNMSYATYSLRPNFQLAEEYLAGVSQLADEVLLAGKDLRPLLDAYGAFVEASGRETRRSRQEYLVEALMIGVLWRARGQEACEAAVLRGDLVSDLIHERRQGESRRRDGSNASIAAPTATCGVNAATTAAARTRERAKHCHSWC